MLLFSKIYHYSYESGNLLKNNYHKNITSLLLDSGNLCQNDAAFQRYLFVKKGLLLKKKLRTVFLKGFWLLRNIIRNIIIVLTYYYLQVHDHKRILESIKT